MTDEDEDEEAHEKKKSFSGFSIRVENQSTLTPELEEEFKNVLEAYGHNPDFCGWSTYGKCSSDSDCTAGGCSGQVCQSKYEEPVITTCEWKDCYDASKYSLKCRCIDGRCQWSK